MMRGFFWPLYWALDCCTRGVAWLLALRRGGLVPLGAGVPDVSFDPLDDEFRELERAVAAREAAKRCAATGHEWLMLHSSMVWDASGGGCLARLCTRCGRREDATQVADTPAPVGVGVGASRARGVDSTG